MKANYGRGRHAPPIEERFWYFVEKTETCWLWRGSLASGYGYLGINYKKIGAHVFSWELHHGKIPDGLWVLHRCDVRNCVRPDHLFLGTQLENMQDCLNKGRHKFGRFPGELHTNAKLTWDAVRQIKELYPSGKYRQLDLAIKFGVSRSAVRNVLAGVNWR